jgi:hypothetical protein
LQGLVAKNIFTEIQGTPLQVIITKRAQFSELPLAIQPLACQGKFSCTESKSLLASNSAVQLTVELFGQA